MGIATLTNKKENSAIHTTYKAAAAAAKTNKYHCVIVNFYFKRARLVSLK